MNPALLLLTLACGAGPQPGATEEPMSTHQPSLDGTGDWAGLLARSTPDEAAATALASAQPAVLLRPGSPELGRLAPEARALITPPALGQSPAGEPQLSFWMGQPPGFGPVRVQVSVPPSGPARVERQGLDTLLPAEAQEAVLLRALGEGSRKEKQNAATALGERRSAAAVPGLLALLQDPYAGARADAAEALGRIADPAAVDGLGAALAKEPDLAAGMKMVTALRAIGGPAARAALEAAAAQAVEPTLAQQAREAAAGL